MKLLISDKTIIGVSDFAMKCGAQGVVFEDLEITVSFLEMSVKFFQPERYNQLITCYFEFANDIGFFFEDVLSAIEGHPDTQHVTVDEQPASVVVLTRNNSYVHHVIAYCEKNIDLITSVSPPWFQRAASIADVATRKNFPDLADEDMWKKQKLWEFWQQRNRD
jgi:hypothetical protein